MAGGGSGGSGGLGAMVRQLLIVVVLFWAMSQASIFEGLHPAGSEPIALAAFGFIVLAAYALGELAEHVKLPHITGYLLAGVVCGDFFLGLLSHEVVDTLKVFDILAIALIAMEAGSALDIEGLKERWRSVASLTTVMILVCLAAGLGFAGLTSGVVPAIELPLFEGYGSGTVLAAGALIGVMILAMSPPVTLAVISETKAKGPFTDTLLTSVIINNVLVVLLFAVAIAVGHALDTGPLDPSLLQDAAQGAAEHGGGDHGGGGHGAEASGGHGGGESNGAGDVPLAMLKSLLLGMAIGSAAAVTLRFIRDDAAVAIVGLCFVGSYMADQLGGDRLLTFLTAGAFLTSATRQGEPFKKVARTLSGPVYVLFFTLVGAGLHIEALLETFPFAIAIVLMRLAAYWLSIRGADLAVPLPDTLKTYGALGFAPQAGIALTIAIGAKNEFAGWGVDFETLGLAAIALNEMVGPVLLKLSLGLAGETRDSEGDGGAPVQTPESVGKGEELLAEEAWSGELAEDPFGQPVDTGIAALDERARELAQELRELSHDIVGGPISTRQVEAQAFLHGLRRELLRTHRRLTVQAGEAEADPAELLDTLQAERGELATRWRGQLLSRAAEVDYREERELIGYIIDRGKAAVAELPVAVTGTLEPDALTASEGDGPVARLQKLGLRARGRLSRSGRDRVVPLRELGRYHLEGQLPIYLLELAGLFTLTERRLLESARNLFGTYHRQLEGFLIHEREVSSPPDVRVAELGRIRRELESELQAAMDEVDALAEETARVGGHALGRAWRRLVEHLELAGTPELSPREHRYSRIYPETREAIKRLEGAFEAASRTTRGVAGAMAMELELLRLRGRVDPVTEHTAQQVGRDVHGRITLQLDRISTALDEGADRMEAAVSAEAPRAHELLARIEETTEPIAKVVEEAVTIAESYKVQLGDLQAFDTLLGELHAAIEELTDRVDAVFGAPAPRGRGLPPPTEPVEVAFRQTVRSALEADLSRQLAELSNEIEQQLEEAWQGLQELDRVLLFNRELARTELEVLGEGRVPPKVLEVLDETLVQATHRMDKRVVVLRESSRAFQTGLVMRIREAVLGNLDELERQLLDGELQGRGGGRTGKTSRGPAAAGSGGGSGTGAGGIERVRGLTGQLLDVVQRSDEVARSALGDRALDEVRESLGLPRQVTPPELGPRLFAPVEPAAAVPLAYRRLFGDRSLEAGDLLVGHEARVAELRQVLLGEGPGSSRAVAIVGLSGPGSVRVVHSLFRGIGESARVERHTFGAPGPGQAELAELAREAREAAGNGDKPAIFVIDGFHWLFTLEPGGFQPLRRFMDLVVETRRQVGWLVSCDAACWHYLDRVVPVDAAFPERLELGPLDRDGLRRALLARHAMSGYLLRFDRPEDTLQWWLRELFATRTQEARLYEEAFFDRIHEESGGHLPDALRLWMAAVRGVQESTDTVILGPPPRSRVDALRQLDDDMLLALRQAVRQGHLGVEDFSHQFRLAPDEARARLAQLDHWGLIVPAGEGWFELRAELDGAIHRVLVERRLVG